MEDERTGGDAEGAERRGGAGGGEEREDGKTQE